MAFCTNCGRQLVEGAKFCSECGSKASMPGVSQNEQRRTVYEGEIHKCPNCGETLNSFVAVCPACGMELRGAKNVDSIVIFVSKLEAARTEWQLINVIRNQPIPNTKEDVMEFLMIAINNLSGANSNDIRNAWQTKLNQVYQKATMILPEKDMVRVNALYHETLDNMRAHDAQQRRKAKEEAVGKAAAGFGSACSSGARGMAKVFAVVAKNVLSFLSAIAYINDASIILLFTPSFSIVSSPITELAYIDITPLIRNAIDISKAVNWLFSATIGKK